MKIKIAPSILSADFGRLAEEIRMVEEAGAHLLHIDVMDGHFVPNLTYGPLIVSKCKEITSLPLDVHLMITNAEERLDSYLDAGADYLSIHAEAVIHMQRTLDYIRKAGAKAGVALNPATPLNALDWVMEDLDFVLIMSVNPGFGAQAFIPSSTRRISEAAALLKLGNQPVEIEVDGGVGPANAGELAAAGATMLVAGNAIFKAGNPAAVVREMVSAAESAGSSR
ncbi:MAG TPA: ribulose-phosphate 3-epimerase [Acidobacteriota bacterium]|nr:ribulose-phosphate 3-epimerase [Acidobacteriota bacterium]